MSEGLKQFDGVAYVSEPTQNEAGDLTVVQVTPTSGPTTQETRELVTHLGDRAGEVNAANGVDAYVTGQTAINIETADRLNASLGKRAWWMPKRLGRILPEVDIEGEKVAQSPV